MPQTHRKLTRTRPILHTEELVAALWDDFEDLGMPFPKKTYPPILPAGLASLKAYSWRPKGMEYFQRSLLQVCS